MYIIFRNFIIFTLFQMIYTSGVYSATLTVCASGCDYTTIQEAYDACSDGDIISVDDSVHVEPGFPIEGIRLNRTISVTIRGHGMDESRVTPYSGTGSEPRRVFTITSASGSITFQDISIRGGITDTQGGGIYKDNGCSLMIDACKISSNDCIGVCYGIGLFVAGGRTVIQNSEISYNYLETDVGDFIGGGIYSNTEVYIYDSSITNNGNGSISNPDG